MERRYAYKTSDGGRLAASRADRPARHPCRRAVDGTAIARPKRIRKSASITKARWNVLVERRISPKFVADASLRVDYARRKVLDGGNYVVLAEKFFRELFKVKPLVDTATELSIVEMASVDVDYYCFHSQPLKVQGPESLPAPRRLPESRRVKRPVIGGTWYCTKFSARM